MLINSLTSFRSFCPAGRQFNNKFYSPHPLSTSSTFSLLRPLSKSCPVMMMIFLQMLHVRLHFLCMTLFLLLNYLRLTHCTMNVPSHPIHLTSWAVQHSVFRHHGIHWTKKKKKNKTTTNGTSFRNHHELELNIDKRQETTTESWLLWLSKKKKTRNKLRGDSQCIK